MAFIDTRVLQFHEPLPGWTGRYLHSEHVTFGCYAVRAGASIHAHAHANAHANEEVWHVLEGELEATLDGERRVAGPGMAALVPAHTRHAAKALSDGRSIVVDHPVRRAIGGART